MAEFISNPLLLKEIDRLNMNVFDATYGKLDSSWCAPKSSSSFTRIYMVTAGEGFIRCDRREVRMTPGNIYIIPAGLEFSYFCPNILEKFYCHISIPRYNRYDLLNGYPDFIILPDMQEKINQTISDFKIANMNSIFHLKQQLWDIIRLSLDQAQIELDKIEIYSKKIKATIQYITATIHTSTDKNVSPIRNRLSTAKIAEIIELPADILQRDFRIQTHIPLRRYINDQIFISAENLLRSSDLTVGEISTRLGFCDQFYFSRSFADRYGISPREYRKKLGAKRP